MAYANFKPLIWSKHIQHELKKFTVFEGDCNYQFSGEAAKGKTVKILGVARPTIGTYAGTTIGSPETVPDSSVMLPIDQYKFFNFQVDDVDEAQSIEGLMAALMEESTRAMAETRDSYIAQIAALGAATASASTDVTSAAIAKGLIDAGLITLWGAGLSQKDDITIYLNPTTYMWMQEYITETKTVNDAAIASGILGNYGGAKIKMSNNFYNDGTDDYCFIKSSKAVAFCGGINEVEAYRPETLFSDAIRGLNTYGAKVVRPKELYVIKAH
jgi:hypothetical protein